MTTVIVACIAGLLGGMSAMWSSLLGGVCCVVPNGFFAWRLYMGTLKPGGATADTFFYGEFLKILLTIALMGAVAMKYSDVNWLAFLAGFILVLKSYLILLIRR
jgi:ATP synthase protein I